MCLLDQVVEWTNESIVCLTNTHRAPSNPLRSHDQLSILHAFEYAAQAAAVHGGLCARAEGKTAPPGYLAALRDANVYGTRLDTIPSPLEVIARRLFGDAANNVYEIRVAAGDKLVAEGRITIVERT